MEGKKSSSGSLKAVELASPPLTDISAQLRHMADQIDEGVLPCAKIVVVAVSSNNEIYTFGFGDIGRTVEAAGWLAKAIVEM